MKLRNTIALSFQTVRSNRLRTTITVIIIALGIMALISIITAVEAVNISLTESFSTMGANSFSLRHRERTVRFGGPPRGDARVTRRNVRSRVAKEGRVITFDEARAFSRNFRFPARVGIALAGPAGIIVSQASVKTSPDIRLIGGDVNYLAINGYELLTGRNFSEADVESGRSVCVISSVVARKLYSDKAEKALDRVITVANSKYRVIGVLKDKGSSAFMNADKVVITTYNNIRRIFGSDGKSYNIAVQVPDMKMMDVAVGEAVGVFRPIRKLLVKDADNFYVDKSDSIVQSFIKNLGFLKYATLAIALITLIGAAIGLMNIMLVAVNERTREIGLIKSIGGKASEVRAQFLWEAVIISLLGAVVGILAGILLGNLVALLLKTGFVIPWAWVGAGVVVCSIVGLAAGLLPAIKASRLDPIIALRYE